MHWQSSTAARPSVIVLQLPDFALVPVNFPLQPLDLLLVVLDLLLVMLSECSQLLLFLTPASIKLKVSPTRTTVLL